jgi:predicted RNA-binding protein Jag
MTGTLKDLVDRLRGKRRADAVEREVEAEQMSPAERRIVGESVEDRQADVAAEEHLGGIEPDRLLDDDTPPRV